MHSLTEKLQSMPLLAKIFALIILALLLFASNLFVKTGRWHIYWLALLVFVVFLSSICRLVIGRRAFKALLQLWSIGIIIYLCFAIPRIYLHGSLTPYFTLTNIYDRWLYSMLLPLIILGTLATGLTFIKIVSPVEFLSWRKFGLHFVLLFRAIQHAGQAFHETKLALMMQDKWPEENQFLFKPHAMKLILKYSPDLICTTFRNVILYWFPWGWLCFHKLQKDYKIRRSSRKNYRGKDAI